jgi:hypothetical protein
VPERGWLLPLLLGQRLVLLVMLLRLPCEVEGCELIGYPAHSPVLVVGLHRRGDGGYLLGIALLDELGALCVVDRLAHCSSHHVVLQLSEHRAEEGADKDSHVPEDQDRIELDVPQTGPRRYADNAHACTWYM